MPSPVRLMRKADRSNGRSPTTPAIIAEARDDPADGNHYRLTGSVRLEGTGEPVAGATVEVMIADSGQGHRGANRTALSGADGRFTVDLPPGSARSWTLIAPVGYWAPAMISRSPRSSSSPGTSRSTARITWFAGAPSGISASPAPRKRSLSRGWSWLSIRRQQFFRSEVDDAGRVRLTLPTEAGQGHGQRRGDTRWRLTGSR